MVDPRLLRVASDPVRLRVLVLLNEGVASESELAAKLDVSVGVARRHLKALHDEEMIEAVEGGVESGEHTAEPHYRPLLRALWDEKEWAEFSVEEQKRMTRWIVDTILSDVDEALDLGTYTARVSSHVSRTVPMVDEQGWKELCRVYADTLNTIFAIEAASAERLAERREAGFPALAAMICCELPGRRGVSGPEPPDSPS